MKEEVVELRVIRPCRNFVHPRNSDADWAERSPTLHARIRAILVTDHSSRGTIRNLPVRG